MANYNQTETESNNMEVVSNETIFNSGKVFYDYLISLKSQNADNNCDFCAAFMTF